MSGVTVVARVWFGHWLVIVLRNVVHFESNLPRTAALFRVCLSIQRASSERTLLHQGKEHGHENQHVNR